MKDFKSIYFVGAGGIGMAALERYYLSKGIKVAGYDRTATDLTRALADEGVEISYEQGADVIPDYCRNAADTLVVYTAAMPADDPKLAYFSAGGFTMMKRAQLLGLITRDSKGICISGTHGKTPPSSIVAHILNTSTVG